MSSNHWPVEAPSFYGQCTCMTSTNEQCPLPGRMCKKQRPGSKTIIVLGTRVILEREGHHTVCVGAAFCPSVPSWSNCWAIGFSLKTSIYAASRAVASLPALLSQAFGCIWWEEVEAGVSKRVVWNFHGETADLEDQIDDLFSVAVGYGRFER